MPEKHRLEDKIYVKTYLLQNMKLEQRIKLNKLELEDLRKLATSVSSVRYGS